MTTALFSVLVLGVLALLFGAVDALQRRGRLGPEAGRKTVHIGMGLVGLSLPWFFRTAGPVWFLAGLAAVFLGSIRLVPAVGRRLGNVLGGVDRASLGDMFYPMGVAAAFCLGEGKAAFCGAVATLAFGDTAGAMVGPRWGRLRYSLFGNHKSVEGSGAVLLTSAAWIAGLLLVLGHETLPAALAGALLVATAAALIEAASWLGLDNFLLPVAVAWLAGAWLDGRIAHRSATTFAALAAALLLCLSAGVLVAAVRLRSGAAPRAG